MKFAKVLALGAALSVVAAPSFAQRPGGFGGGFGGRGGGAFLLRMPEVQKELKIDEGQMEALKLIQEAQQSKMREEFGKLRDLPEQERFAKFQELGTKMAADNEKEIGKLLNANQVARLKQLELQQAGTRALGRTDVQTQLKISADQKQKIDAALKTERDAVQALFAGFRNSGERPSEDQIRESRTKMEATRKDTETRLLATLTDAQKKQFEGMKGAPFTFPQRQFGRPGGNNNN